MAILNALRKGSPMSRHSGAHYDEAPPEGGPNVSKQSLDEFKSLNDAARYWIQNNVSAKSPWNANKLADYVTWMNGRPEVPVLIKDLEALAGKDKHPAIQVGPVGPNVPVTYLLGWAKGGETPIHDHADSQVAVIVHQGTIREDVFATAGKKLGLLTEKGQTVGVQRIRRTTKVGAPAIKLMSPHIHQVGNDAEPYAATIHSYYPPLDKMGFYEFSRGGPGEPGGPTAGKLTSTGMYQDDDVLKPVKVGTSRPSAKRRARMRAQVRRALG